MAARYFVLCVMRVMSDAMGECVLQVVGGCFDCFYVVSFVGGGVDNF